MVMVNPALALWLLTTSISAAVRVASKNQTTSLCPLKQVKVFICPVRKPAFFKFPGKTIGQDEVLMFPTTQFQSFPFIKNQA